MLHIKNNNLHKLFLLAMQSPQRLEHYYNPAAKSDREWFSPPLVTETYFQSVSVFFIILFQSLYICGVLYLHSVIVNRGNPQNKKIHNRIFRDKYMNDLQEIILSWWYFMLYEPALCLWGKYNCLCSFCSDFFWKSVVSGIYPISLQYITAHLLQVCSG